ncbi:hypothetical protein [Ruminococcus albus]|uniref:Uncharacterized protein n=1 Tax=Ruminococcus albus TaxID=1264 RepID=A0A1I1FXY9_RUMAL|nr:hypothetical protein [Ruminococcus albus]SFC04131.1 hypothetical protein SAMN02910406_01051 [Ruminococcus albus]
MKGFKQLSLMLVVLLIFTLVMTVIAVLAKGVNEGRIDGHVLAKAIILIVIAVLGGLILAFVSACRKHKAHMKQASSADILAEIMAMKDDNKNNSKED